MESPSAGLKRGLQVLLYEGAGLRLSGFDELERAYRVGAVQGGGVQADTILGAAGSSAFCGSRSEGSSNLDLVVDLPRVEIL